MRSLTFLMMRRSSSILSSCWWWAQTAYPPSHHHHHHKVDVTSKGPNHCQCNYISLYCTLSTPLASKWGTTHYILESSREDPARLWELPTTFPPCKRLITPICRKSHPQVTENGTSNLSFTTKQLFLLESSLIPLSLSTSTKECNKGPFQAYGSPLSEWKEPDFGEGRTHKNILTNLGSAIECHK